MHRQTSRVTPATVLAGSEKRRLVVGVLLLLVTAGCTGSEQSRGGAEVVGEVREAWATFHGALTAGDLDAAIDFYSEDPDFRWIEDGAIVYRSKEQVRTSLSQLSEFGAVTFDFGAPSVLALGDRHASLTVEATTKIEPPDGGALEFTVQQSIVLRRESAGWRFLQGHSSSPNRGGTGG